MAVNREALKLFYSVSSLWRSIDQKFLGAVGFEFELAECAFNELHTWCLKYTDFDVERWKLADDCCITNATIHARAFADHAVRVQHLIKSMVGETGGIAALAEKFYQDNRSVFELRNAIHHVGSRLANDDSLRQQQPLYGDLSWKCATPPTTVDTYWVCFGPMLAGEFASPIISTTTSLRTPIDELIYRAHGITVNLGHAFLSLCEFVEAAHSRLAQALNGQMDAVGAKRTEEFEQKANQGLHGRFRLQGLEMNVGPTGVSGVEY